MGEYWEWQQEGNGLKIRVHRRVLAGLEHEGAREFRGIMLGNVVPETREIFVEDYARLEGNREFEPIEEWLAETGKHSLPAVGYFRVDSRADLQISEHDREVFARHFRNTLDILLLF